MRALFRQLPFAKAKGFLTRKATSGIKKIMIILACNVKTPEGRERASESFRRSVIKSSNKKILSSRLDFYSWLKEKVADGDLVVLLNESILLNGDEIEHLREDLQIKPLAGIISANMVELPLKYRVDDIYSPSETLGVEGGGLVEVDMAFPYLVICKGKVYKEIEVSGRGLFGLNLRRLGYQNYLDKNIKIGYGEDGS